MSETKNPTNYENDGQEMIVLLEHWKRRKRSMKILKRQNVCYTKISIINISKFVSTKKEV